MSWRHVRAGVLCVIVLSAITGACGGDEDGSDGDGPGDEGSPIVATSISSPSAAPTADAAIAPLVGTWRTVISEGDSVTLILRPGRYSISRGAAAGAGRMEATASEVEFSGSDLCDGLGRYSWSISDGELTFTSVTRDECSGRSEVLDGKTYRK